MCFGGCRGVGEREEDIGTGERLRAGNEDLYSSRLNIELEGFDALHQLGTAAFPRRSVLDRHVSTRRYDMKRDRDLVEGLRNLDVYIQSCGDSTAYTVYEDQPGSNRSAI